MFLRLVGVERAENEVVDNNAVGIHADASPL